MSLKKRTTIESLVAELVRRACTSISPVRIRSSRSIGLPLLSNLILRPVLQFVLGLLKLVLCLSLLLSFERISYIIVVLALDVDIRHGRQAR